MPSAEGVQRRGRAARRQDGLFSGWVAENGGARIPGATVEVGGRTTTTDGAGAFRLEVAEKQLYILNISHRDFADLSHITPFPLAGNTWRLARAQVEEVDPGRADQAGRQPRRGGASLEIPADSLVDEGGKKPSGKLRAAIATLDLARGEGPGDWAVRSDDGKLDGYLVSYGAVFVQFTDAAGRRYQLRSGRSGQLSLPVTPAMAAHALATPAARFWYYDSRDGYWKNRATGPTTRPPRLMPARSSTCRP